MTGDRGHRSVPHTADLSIEAWSPELRGCLSEMCVALVEEFVEFPDVGDTDRRPFRLLAPDRPRLLAALVDEVIFAVDAEGLVPHDVGIEDLGDSTGGWSCTGTMTVVPLSRCRQIGSAPKSVSLSGLDVSPTASGWIARAVIDI